MSDTLFKTADLCDAFEGKVQVCEPLLRMYGGHTTFHGRIETIKCFEDNSLVREQVRLPGDGRVLVVDAGGSKRCAMLGDLLAAAAYDYGWAGVIVYGLIRDSAEIAKMKLGVAAMGTIPIKSVKRGEGQLGITVRFAGVEFRRGYYCYADSDGIIVSAKPLIND